MRVLDQLADARLGSQIRVWITIFVTCAFGVKANHVAGAFTANLRQPAKRVFIELAFLWQRLVAAGKERWVHRPPTHHQIYQHAGRRLIEEATTHGKEKLFAPA